MIHRIFAAIAIAATLGASPRVDPVRATAVASFALPQLPFLPGSMVPIDIDGLTAPYKLDVLGPGRVDTSTYFIPSDVTGAATLLAADNSAVAMRTIGFAPPPDPGRAFIAVASYDDGVVIHDAGAPFEQQSVFGIGGSPSGVAIDPDGRIGAGATNGTMAATATIQPWHVHAFDNVPFADEVAFDTATHALYATNRDVNGVGAITRIAADGTVRTRVLGLTAEGLVVDAKRRRVYVANVNDGTISIVDADSLVELQRFKAVARVFSLALSGDGSTLYAVSNQSLTSPFAAAGSVISIDVSGKNAHVLAHSGVLSFPLGVALDERHGRLFVTDERDDDVYVLDPRSLRPLRAPLRTCRTPWTPTLDNGLLYLPCARADKVDVYDTATLGRVAGAPFATGGYPLAVAVWHPKPSVKR